MIKNFAVVVFAILLHLTSIAQINHWETAVYNSDTWQYFIGNSEPPSNWMTVGFNDANWQSGKGGIGYGDEDDETIIEPTYALYLRHSFTIVDVAAIERLILQADYDDAFVAYLNGVEIARANILGNPPKFNTETFNDHEATLYQNNTLESTFLSKEEIANLLRPNENVLAISVHNRFGPASSDMTANFFLTLGINNTSTDYRPTPNWFVPPAFSSKLPIVKLTTNWTINAQTTVTGQIGIIQNESGDNSLFDMPNEYAGAVGIKYRGQSSLWFDKKNYSIEMRDEFGVDMDTSFLDFPKEEDWILHGPYADKSLMRNVLVMDLARKMGQYASRTVYVDLFINDDYQGIYVLMEKIKRDKNRVDIAKLKELDIDGNELTGGYIFKIDKGDANWLSRYSFYQSSDKLKYQLVYPDLDKVQAAQFTYIKSYVDSFERAMANPNLNFGGKSFDEYIDLTSFAEAHLLNELGRNVDGYRLSSYFHKQKDSNGGKIKAGPVWDFNLAFRNADYCEGADTDGLIFDRLCDGGYPFWWSVLLANEQFQSIVRCRWENLRATSFQTDSIFAFMDEQVVIVTPSINQNFDKWKILGNYLWPNPLPLANTYTQEIDLLKDWLTARLDWMDNNIGGTCQMLVNTIDIEKIAPFKVVPNPASDKIQLSFDENLIPKIESVFMINTVGLRFQLAKNSNSLTFNINHLTAGIYFVEVQTDEGIYTQKMIIK